MKALIVSAMAGAFALGAVAAAPAANDSMMNMVPGCHGIVMNGVGGSGERGCATVKGGNGVMILSIAVKGEPANAVQPAHIHQGMCGSNGPVMIPLKNVVGGMSTTSIPMAKWKMVSMGKSYINIHKSASDIPTIVTCGDIKAMKQPGMM